MILLVLAAAAPSGGDNTALLVTLATALIGAIGASGFQWYKYRNERVATQDSMIAEATTQAVAAAKEMLAEYRVELMRAKADMQELQNRLSEANDRIGRLEKDLDASHGLRRDCQAALSAALAERAATVTELEMVRDRVGYLESIVGRV